MDVTEKIQQAKSQGYSDEEINSYLKKKGISVPKPKAEWSDLPGNILPSAARFGGDVLSAFMNPGQTLYNIGGLTTGAASKIIPGQATGAAELEGERMVNALGDFYKQRYGGAENIKESTITDPVGVLADFAGLLSGTGGAIRTAGTVGKIGGLAKAGGTIAKVGSAIDPLNIAGKAASPITSKIARSVEQAPGDIVSRTIQPNTKGMREKQYMSELLKGKETTGQQFAKQEKIPGSVEGVIKKADKMEKIVAKEREVAMEPYLERTANVMDIIFPKEPKPGRMSLSQLEDTIKNSAIPNKEPLLQDLNEAMDSILNMGDETGQATLKKLDKYRANTDKHYSKLFEQGKKMEDLSERDILGMAISDEIRNTVNDLVPELSEINQRYGVYKDMKKFAAPMGAKGRFWMPTRQDLPFGFGIGGAAAIAGADPLTSALAALASIYGRKLITSPDTALKAAGTLQKTSKAGKKVKQVSDQVPSESLRMLNYMFSGRPLEEQQQEQL